MTDQMKFAEAERIGDRNAEREEMVCKHDTVESFTGPLLRDLKAMTDYNLHTAIELCVKHRTRSILRDRNQLYTVQGYIESEEEGFCDTIGTLQAAVDALNKWDPDESTGSASTEAFMENMPDTIALGACLEQLKTFYEQCQWLGVMSKVPGEADPDLLTKFEPDESDR